MESHLFRYENILVMGARGERERERERERAAVSFGSYDSEEEEALINDCHHEHEGYITT